MMAKKNKVLTKKHLLRAEKSLRDASAYSQAGRIKEAVTMCMSILDKYPNYHDAMNLLGTIAHQIGQYDLAVSHFEKSLAVKPNFANTHNDLGLSLQALGRVEAAKTCYEQALAIKPDFATAKINLGNIFNELGQVEKAISCYEDALAIKKDLFEAHYNLAIIKPKQKQIPILEKLLTSPTISEKDSMLCNFSLGKIYDSADAYTKAFESCLKGNMLKRKTINYDSQNHSDFVDRLIKIYSKEYFQEKTECISDSKLPVFIVGMPRSGTTLIEQIISNHPKVHGAGELLALARIEKTIVRKFESSSPYPECMSLCNDSALKRLADDYLKEIRDYSQDAIFIIDKMPDNFLRIGLIKSLFPQARIIHCIRNAMDTCTSIFLNYFVNGNKYSFDLIETGQYYLDYTRLMAHWNSLFHTEIHNVEYEKLVMEQEAISKQLFAYLGLEWEDKYLDFYKNKRAVRTTSNLQVRQPIYKNSINRWRNYEKHLEPLATIIKQNSRKKA